MTPNTLSYPAALLPASWDKNKGTIAKMAGETGIGAALAALKQKHARIDWTLLTASGYGKLHNAAEVDSAEKNAKSYYAKNVMPYADEARSVRELAKKVGAKFAANKLIPKASTMTVLEIARQADIVSVACKSLDEEWKAFGAARAKLAKQIDDQKKMIGPNIAKLKKGLLACIAKPGKESWFDNVRDNCRSINNGVQVNPEWKAKFGATWIKYDGDKFYTSLKDEAKLDEKGKKKQNDDIVKMCKEIQGVMPALESYFK